ncbi:uncharacterized protein LOC126318232 [Schistocerca gregaria]|uniref:uncharacterized protein LOC126318232 n=1 Tax=Schistocerca gregaria TaxID=7010 RepID=UPI00211E0F49|nr:uncharacterized protein LOC126318232 [Schistocerca gregaria]
MTRITVEMIRNALEFINPLNQRELDLRGNKVPQIENLGSTNDLYEVIDLSDNIISRLENIPHLTRLTTLFLNNNKITRIAPNLGESTPNLISLTLTNNRLSELADIEPLAGIPSLVYLSLVGNPVQKKAHYRQFLISKLPSLRVLDFKKVKKYEKEEAIKLFQSSQGRALDEVIVQKSKSNTFVPGEEVQEEKDQTFTAEEKEKISKAILNAKSSEELNRLEELLQKKKVPK